MKLRIELDFEPHEAELANELVKTLQALTDHVKINNSQGAGQGAAPPPAEKERPQTRASAPAAASAPTPGTTPVPGERAPAAPQQAAPPILSSQSAPATKPPPPSFPSQSAKQPDSANSTPAPAVIPHLSPSRADEALSVQQPSAELANGVSITETKSSRFQPSGTAEGNQFDSLLTSYQSTIMANDEVARKQVAQKIVSLLPEKIEAHVPNEAFSKFTSTFERKLLQEDAPDNCPVEELCQLLVELPPTLKADLKGKIVSTILRHLMIKRPVSVDRKDFLAHAQVFGAMVQMQFILIEGAVQTMSKLMREEKTRAAAITMLGASAQLCSEQLLTQVDEKKLAALRSALEETTEAELEYDKTYIFDALHWRPVENGHASKLPEAQPPASQPAPAAQQTAPAPGGLLKLEPQIQWRGYASTVRGIVVDNQFGQVVTCCDDSTIRLHNTDSKELQKMEIRGYKYTDMDFNARTQIIVAPGVALDKAQPPIFALYKLQKGVLEHLVNKTAPGAADTVFKLRFMAKGSEEFICAPGQSSEGSISIGRYSPTRLLESSSETAVPLATYQTDQPLITAILAVPTSPLAFLSADRSGKIYIWDVRATKPVITLHPPELPAGSGSNAAVITALETLSPNFVLSGTYGQGINVWDLRHLSRPGEQPKKQLSPCATIKLEGGAVTRLVRIPDTDRQVVVATATNIQTLQITEDGQKAGVVVGQKANSKFYWDAKWATVNGVKTLFAASAAHPVEGTVDVYQGSST